MQLETSTSSLDTQMAKENAIKQVVTSGKESLNQLVSWITANAAKATLFTALTFTAPAAFWQKADVAKNDIKTWESYKPVTTDTLKNTVKIGDEPIKDSVEYKTERDKRITEWKKVLEKKEKNKQLEEQIEMLSWPSNFFERIEKQQWWILTERDWKYARAWIAIIDKRERLTEVKELVIRARKILVYISSQAPQQVITKN